MIRIVVLQQWIRGFSPSVKISNSLCISHIIFADDTLILCDAESSQILYLRVILLAFEAISGLHINFSQSKLFLVNEVQNIQFLADILRCSIGSFPTTYLGLPLGAKSTSVSIWDGVLEKCGKRLSNWKRQYLCLGGRVTRINSVLDALPTYTMSLFPLPASVSDKLD